MLLGDTPIRRKLMTMILVTSGVVLLLTCAAFLTAEFLTFRQAAARQLGTLARVVASNSTAALAFENPADAREILSALRAEPHIIAATLYDRDGHPFAQFPDSLPASSTPGRPGADGYRFESGHLAGFEPVVEGSNARLGTLTSRTTWGPMYQRLRLYARHRAPGDRRRAAARVSPFPKAAGPDLSTRSSVSPRSPRLSPTGVTIRSAPRQLGRDELGELTDAFNHMLSQIQEQNEALRESEGRNRAVVDSSLDAIVAMDHEGSIIGFNRGGGTDLRASELRRHRTVISAKS